MKEVIETLRSAATTLQSKVDFESLAPSQQYFFTNAMAGIFMSIDYLTGYERSSAAKDTKES